MEEKPQQPMPDFEALGKAALEDKSIPRIYCNNFMVTMTSSDATLILQYNNEPIAIVSMSHILAKTMVAKLGGGVVALEKATNTTILTTDDMQRVIQGGQ